MGRKSRLKTKYLPEKLQKIRERLNLSQNEMLRMLNFEELNDRSVISGYERGEREPPLPVLLRYARIAQVNVELLIDDELNLPENISN